MAEALGRSFGGAARLLEGLGGPWAKPNPPYLVRRELCALAATVATITACCLLPDIRGEL